GSPLYVIPSEERAEEYRNKLLEEIETIRFRREINGVIVKADTLGTLEAIVNALNKKSVPVRIADVGPLTKRDVIEASIVAKIDRYLGVILLFNVKAIQEAEELAQKEGVPVFRSNIIYRLIEEYIEWLEKEKSGELQKEFEKIIPPGKIRILPGYIFRRSDPAIVGVEVVGGMIRSGVPLMKMDGKYVGEIQQIQHMGKSIKDAKAGQEVAISIKGNVMVGRHIKENDLLYTDIPLDHIKLLLSKFKDMLSPDAVDVLREIIKIKSAIDIGYTIFLTQI
ncbi:MAG: translation initiation factor IF-2, partial [Ignisphaera sp.]